MKEALSQKKYRPHQILFFPLPVLIDTHSSEFSKLKTAVDLIKKYIENLKAKIEAIIIINVYERSISHPKKFQ